MPGMLGDVRVSRQKLAVITERRWISMVNKAFVLIETAVGRTREVTTDLRQRDRPL